MFSVPEWGKMRIYEMSVWNFWSFSEKKEVINGNYCTVHRTCYFCRKMRGLDRYLSCGVHQAVDLCIWLELQFESCHVSGSFIIHATCSLYFLPGNPNSVMSPASSSQSEEQQYLEKLKQLSKYIEPLRRMINKIDKNEGELHFHAFLCQLSLLMEETVCYLFMMVFISGIKNEWQLFFLTIVTVLLGIMSTILKFLSVFLHFWCFWVTFW